MTTVTETPAAANPAVVPDAAELQAMLRQALDNHQQFQAVVRELQHLVALPTPKVVDVLKPTAPVSATAADAAYEACGTIRAFIRTSVGWEAEEDALAAMTAVGLLERTVHAAEALLVPRPSSAPANTPAEVPPADNVEDEEDDEDAAGTRTYHVYYVGHVDRRHSARLDIVDDEIADAERDHYHGTYDDVELVGTVSLDQDAFRFEIEAEAMAAFGGHAGHSGRPAFARYSEAAEWDRIAGEVAVVLLTWPRFAPETPEGRPTDPGPATAEAIAAATGRSVLDVRDTIAELRKPAVG